MIKSDLVTTVRGLLDDDSYEENIIVDASNWFVNELCMNNKLRFMESSEELNAYAGDTEMDLPDDLQTLISFYVTAPQVYDMMSGYVSYGDFMRGNARFASNSVSQARQWTDFANGIRFGAPLNAEHTFQCDYIRRPTPVEADDDEYELPSNYDELLVRGTLARVMERNEDYAEAQQERGNLDSMITAFVRNEARGQIKTGPVVIRTGRRRHARDVREF